MVGVSQIDATADPTPNDPPRRRGGCRKPTRPKPHRTPCHLRRRGRTGQDTTQKPFFGALDELSRRTLVLLPHSTERRSETPLFDSDGCHASGRSRPWPWSGPPRANRRTMRDAAKAVRHREPADGDHALVAVRPGMRPFCEDRCFGVVPTVSRRHATSRRPCWRLVGPLLMRLAAKLCVGVSVLADFQRLACG